jgi:putative phosphoesterase
MRIGIISDIHGDYSTLKDVLNRFDQHHHVDHILCAGDLVGRGPEQDRVVEVIRKRKIPVARGNHDEWFYNLTDENTAFLKSLPVDWKGEFGGTTVYMCHGKPGNNMWGMYKDHLSKVYLKMVLKSLGADVLITGHTHVPLHLRSKQGILINSGSLYSFNSSRETSHTYGVLTVPELGFEVYDVKAPVGSPPIDIP